MKDINGQWMQDFAFRGRALRVFFAGLARPYFSRYLNMVLFGAGPLRFMYWPKRPK